MENTLKKTFINNQLGIKFNSYIDEQFNVCFKQNKLLKYLVTKIQLMLLRDM